MAAVLPPPNPAPTPAPGPLPAAGVDRASAAQSAMWSVVENGGLAVISFMSLIVYSRLLTVSDFGLFSIALAVVELLGVLVTMLFHDALVQRRDVTEQHYDSAFCATLLLSAALTALCWWIAPLFAQRFGQPEAADVLRWTALSLPLSAVSATIVARQRRQLRFRSLAVRSLVGRSLGAAIGIALVLLGYSFWGLVAQQVLVALFGSLVLWLGCRERPALRFRWREFVELFRFGSQSVAALFLVFSIKRVFIVLSGLSLGTHAAGLLNMSFRAVDTFWALAATAISQTALPVLSKLTHDTARFHRAFHTATAFTCLVLYFCFVLIAATSAEVVELLFGPQWLQIAPFVTALGLQVLVQSTRLLMSPVLTALGRPRDLILGQSVELVFLLVAIWLSGVPSVAWAIAIWVARECLGAALQAVLMRRATALTLRQQFGGVVAPLVSALVMFAAVWLCRMALPPDWNAITRLLVLAPVAALAYAGCALVIAPKLLAELLGFGRAAFARAAGPAAHG